MRTRSIDTRCVDAGAVFVPCLQPVLPLAARGSHDGVAPAVHRHCEEVFLQLISCLSNARNAKIGIMPRNAVVQERIYALRYVSSYYCSTISFKAGLARRGTRYRKEFSDSILQHHGFTIGQTTVEHVEHLARRPALCSIQGKA